MQRFASRSWRHTAVKRIGTVTPILRPSSTVPAAKENLQGSSVHPFEEMPTENGKSWLFGVSLDAMKGIEGSFKVIQDWKEAHGNLFRVKIFLGKYLVVVGNTTDTETVIRSEGKYPSRGDTTRPWKVILDSFSRAKVSTANLLVTSDGPEWQQMRSSMNPLFIPRKLGRHVHRLNEVCDTFLELVKGSVEADGYSQDVMKFLPNWSAESVSRFLYPQSINFQTSDSQRNRDIYEGMQGFLMSSSAYIYPEFMLKYFPIKAMKEGKVGFEKFKKASLDILREAEESGAVSTGNPAEGTFMEQWKAQGFSDDTISAVMADFIAAGTDTTVSTAAFVLHRLALHPSVQEKAHQQVLSVVGRDGEITDEAMQNLPYIKAIQKETARFAAFTPGTGRVLEESTVIGGYQIPPKTMIIMSSAIMGQDPEIFENPHEFRPERWLGDASKEKRHQQQLATGVFGFGPRNCIGRRIAEFELWTLIAKIMQKNRLDLHTDSLDLQPVGGATSYRPDRPLRVRVSSIS